MSNKGFGIHSTDWNTDTRSLRHFYRVTIFCFLTFFSQDIEGGLHVDGESLVQLLRRHWRPLLAVLLLFILFYGLLLAYCVKAASRTEALEQLTKESIRQIADLRNRFPWSSRGWQAEMAISVEGTQAWDITVSYLVMLKYWIEIL